jgi:hypothetical protein
MAEAGLAREVLGVGSNVFALISHAFLVFRGFDGELFDDLKNALHLALFFLRFAAGHGKDCKGQQLADKVRSQFVKIKKLPGMLRAFFDAPSVTCIADC